MGNLIGRYAIDQQDNCYEIVAQWNDWIMVNDGQSCASIRSEHCQIVDDEVIEMANRIAKRANDKTNLPWGGIVRIAALAVLEIGDSK